MEKNNENKDIKKNAEDEQQTEESVSDNEPYNEDKWEEVSEGEVVKLKVGESIEGTLISVEHSNRYNSGIYKIKANGSDVPKVLVGTKMLDRKMKTIDIDTEIKILREPDVATDKGNPMHVYKVFTPKE